MKETKLEEIKVNGVVFEVTKRTGRLITKAMQLNVGNYDLTFDDARTLIKPMIYQRENAFSVMRVIFNVGFLQGQKQMRAHSKKISCKIDDSVVR